MSRFIGTVRSRLNREGLKKFSKEEILDAAIAIDCVDLNEPTPDELKAAVDYLREQRTKQLSGEVIPTVQQPVREPLRFDGQKKDEVETEFPSSTLPDDDLLTSQGDNPEEENSSTSLSIDGNDNTALIKSSDVDLIADEVNAAAQDFDQVLGEVKEALLSYANFTADTTDNKIQNVMSEVRGLVVVRQKDSVHKLSNHLTGLREDLRISREQTKSQLSIIVQRLKTF